MFRNPATDLIVALVIALLMFGPKRLPGLGKQLGRGLREFKDSIGGDSKEEESERPALGRAPDPVPGTRSPPSKSHASSGGADAADSAETGSERRSR